LNAEVRRREWVASACKALGHYKLDHVRVNMMRVGNGSDSAYGYLKSATTSPVHRKSGYNYWELMFEYAGYLVDMSVHVSSLSTLYYPTSRSVDP
jgi:hypothetical protein